MKRRGLTPKQLELRKGVLGGTDTGAVLGISKWRNAFNVYAEKVGDAPLVVSEPSPEMLWGLLLEDPIRRYYAELHEKKVRRPRGLVRHEKHPWMGGHLDGEAEDRGLEIKTARWSSDWGETGSEEIPAVYRAQVWWYMAVTGLRLFDVAVLIGGSDYREYTLEWKPEIDDLVAEMHDWWFAHVVPRIPPDWDGSEAGTQYLRRQYPAENGSTLVALPHQYEPLQAYKDARARAELWKRQQDMYGQIIQAAMGEAKKLESPILTATLGNVKSYGKVNWKVYATALEEMIGQLVLGTYPLKDDPIETVGTLKSLYTTPVDATRRFEVKIHGPQELGEGNG